jgi:hypothetical protein
VLRYVSHLSNLVIENANRFYRLLAQDACMVPMGGDLVVSIRPVPVQEDEMRLYDYNMIPDDYQ